MPRRLIMLGSAMAVAVAACTSVSSPDLPESDATAETSRSAVATTTRPSTTTTAATTTTTTAVSTTTMPIVEMIQTIEDDGISDDRPVVHLAPATLGADPKPLVVMLHAYAGLAETAVDGAVRDLVVDRGWFLVAPSGMVDDDGNRYWAATPTCCDADNRRNDDLGYLRSIILDALVRYSADRDHVVVVGGSNGGFMAYQLACHASDLITAVVVLAASDSNSERACQPDHPVSVFHVHGRDDQAVKFDGGELSVIRERIAPYPSAPETVSRWSRRNDCPSADSTVPGVGDQGSWSHCAAGTSVHYQWLDQGHAVLMPPELVAEMLGFIASGARGPTGIIR